MKLRFGILSTAAAVLFALFTAAGSADASIITMQYAGIFNLGSDVVFGQTGAAVPFNFSITYDTSLGTQQQFLAAGSVHQGFTLANAFYGYSKAGITSFSLTFGTKTWTLDDLQPRTAFAGFTADF